MGLESEPEQFFIQTDLWCGLGGICIWQGMSQIGNQIELIKVTDCTII